MIEDYQLTVSLLLLSVTKMQIQFWVGIQKKKKKKEYPGKTQINLFCLDSVLLSSPLKICFQSQESNSRGTWCN